MRDHGFPWGELVGTFVGGLEHVRLWLHANGYR
jgi:hypothetical protein